MKFHARLQRGSKTLEQEVELMAHEAANGVRRFRIGSRTRKRTARKSLRVCTHCC